MEAIKNGRTTTAVMMRESPEFLVGCVLEVSEVMGRILHGVFGVWSLVFGVWCLVLFLGSEI